MPEFAQSTDDTPAQTQDPQISESSQSEASDPFVNLTQLVADWNQESSPFDSDDDYSRFFNSLARALHRRQPRNILLQRERGVGEHAVLIEFARKMAAGQYPHLADSQLLRMDCRFTTAEESRELLLTIFHVLAQRSDAVLVLDGMLSLIAPGGNANNRSLLLSLLARSTCPIIGIVSPDEYEQYFAGHPDTDEFFSRVVLNEPSLETSQRLVKRYSEGLSELYSVTIDDRAIERAVKLSDSYILSSRLPTKAIRILSDVCNDLAFEQSQGEKKPMQVTEANVVKRVSEICGVPEPTLAGLPDGVNYQEVLGSRIFGQDHVVEEVATELGLIRAGMVDAGKPASVMLFVGQTGTGKTELAKVVSKLYSASKRLKTFTLGNYSEPHSVSGVIGVPAGYVGHEQGGRLINELNTDPYSVFLMDEADKAHPDVMQPFLNLFDEGWIADQRGVKAHADRAIFILTTNVGQRQIAEMQRKGKSWEEIRTKLMESLSKIRHAKANRPVFSPEFLARIKRVIIFKPLDAEAMANIAQQLCDDLAEKWKRDRQKELLISEDVVAMISQRSTDQNEKSKGKEGGRTVRKTIANTIESALQLAIASNADKYRSCSRVTVERSSGDAGLAVTFD